MNFKIFTIAPHLWLKMVQNLHCIHSQRIKISSPNLNPNTCCIWKVFEHCFIPLKIFGPYYGEIRSLLHSSNDSPIPKSIPKSIILPFSMNLQNEPIYPHPDNEHQNSRLHGISQNYHLYPPLSTETIRTIKAFDIVKFSIFHFDLTTRLLLIFLDYTPLLNSPS